MDLVGRVDGFVAESRWIHIFPRFKDICAKENVMFRTKFEYGSPILISVPVTATQLDQLHGPLHLRYLRNAFLSDKKMGNIKI